MLGIDFQGGTLVQVMFDGPISADKIRDTLAGMGLADAEIQHFGGDREAIIRVKEEATGEDVAGEIIAEKSHWSLDIFPGAHAQKWLPPRSSLIIS